MTKKEYREFLKRPEWKEKSKQIKARDGKKCTKCGATSPLHVHHTKYGSGPPWEVPDE